ncbi:MAG: hypothetical protein QXQ53_04415 [Candidatus Methanosuratincola sp.]
MRKWVVITEKEVKEVEEEALRRWLNRRRRDNLEMYPKSVWVQLQEEIQEMERRGSYEEVDCGGEW